MSYKCRICLPHGESGLLDELLDVKISNNSSGVLDGELLHGAVVAGVEVAGNLADDGLSLDSLSLSSHVLRMSANERVSYHALNVLHLHGHLGADEIIVLQHVYP